MRRPPRRRRRRARARAAAGVRGAARVRVAPSPLKRSAKLRGQVQLARADCSDDEAATKFAYFVNPTDGLLFNSFSRGPGTCYCSWFGLLPQNYKIVFDVGWDLRAAIMTYSVAALNAASYAFLQNRFNCAVVESTVVDLPTQMPKQATGFSALAFDSIHLHSLERLTIDLRKFESVAASTSSFD